MAKDLRPQAHPGARYCVVDEDPYGPTVTFWATWETAFAYWQACISLGPMPLLLERRLDDIVGRHYYGALRDEAKATLIEEWER